VSNRVSRVNELTQAHAWGGSFHFVLFLEFVEFANSDCPRVSGFGSADIDLGRWELIPTVGIRQTKMP
jgi:hypothetical protein